MTEDHRLLELIEQEDFAELEDDEEICMFCYGNGCKDCQYTGVFKD